MILPSESYDLGYDSNVESVRLDCLTCPVTDEHHVLGYVGNLRDVQELIDHHELLWHSWRDLR